MVNKNNWCLSIFTSRCTPKGVAQGEYQLKVQMAKIRNAN